MCVHRSDTAPSPPGCTQTRSPASPATTRRHAECAAHCPCPRRSHHFPAVFSAPFMHSARVRSICYREGHLTSPERFVGMLRAPCQQPAASCPPARVGVRLSPSGPLLRLSDLQPEPHHARARGVLTPRASSVSPRAPPGISVPASALASGSVLVLCATAGRGMASRWIRVNHTLALCLCHFATAGSLCPRLCHPP